MYISQPESYTGKLRLTKARIINHQRYYMYVYISRLQCNVPAAEWYLAFRAVDPVLCKFIQSYITVQCSAKIMLSLCKQTLHCPTITYIILLLKQ